LSADTYRCLVTTSPLSSTGGTAEAYGLLLASKVADLLHIQEPHFFTDCSILESAASTTSILSAPGHWIIRPILADIQKTEAFHPNRISHVSRCFNFKAHHQARLGLRIQASSLAFRCLPSHTGLCTIRDVLSVPSVTPFTLLSVKCC
jgi:hypothetical protein